jgi:hypothetical protein
VDWEIQVKIVRSDTKAIGTLVICVVGLCAMAYALAQGDIRAAGVGAFTVIVLLGVSRKPGSVP